MKTYNLKNWAILTPSGASEWKAMQEESPWGFYIIAYKHRYQVLPHPQMFPDFQKDNWTFKVIEDKQ